MLEIMQAERRKLELDLARVEEQRAMIRGALVEIDGLIQHTMTGMLAAEAVEKCLKQWAP